MKGIIYTRVSSDEQVRGTSLESQEEQCRNYCKKEGIEVVRTFKDEGESAKNANRVEFLRAIDYLEKNKKKIDVFVVLRLDRFSRNTTDHYVVKQKLADCGVQLRSVAEKIGEDPAEQLLEAVLAGVATFDNLVRKQRCMDGLSRKVDQGIWPWKPPVGYKCSRYKKRGERKTAADSIDPETAPIIRRALKEYATGLYTLKTLAQKLDEWGLARIRGGRTNQQFVDRMLGKPFYAGILVNPWTKKEARGAHDPLITEEEFRRIQLIRQGKGYALAGKHLRENPDFPLRKTALCAGCGKSLTAAWSRGRKERYPYYRCYNPTCHLAHKGIAKDDVENAFKQKLSEITPKKEFLGRLRIKVSKKWEQKTHWLALDIAATERQLKTLEEKRERIFEMREEGSYTKEEFAERKQRVDTEIAEIKNARGRANVQQDNLNHRLSNLEQSLSDLGVLWSAVPDHLRPRFQKLVFPSGIVYKQNAGFGTGDLGLLFALSRTFERKKVVDVAGGGI